jgi:tRNA(Arg) A34 adenosine deaminase TadA
MKITIINTIINKLQIEASKSEMSHRHACVAVKNGNIITPTFHNYIRSYIFRYKCGSAHAEMATINYIINSLWKSDMYKNKHVFYKLIYNIKLTDTENTIIKKLRKKCSTIDFIIIKQSKTSSQLGNSRPCCECIRLMKLLNINSVYYTNSNSEIVVERVSKMLNGHKTQIHVSIANNLIY